MDGLVDPPAGADPATTAIGGPAPDVRREYEGTAPNEQSGVGSERLADAAQEHQERVAAERDERTAASDEADAED